MDTDRRRFVTHSSLLGLGGVLAWTQPTGAAPVPTKWDETFDVIVVGTGLAGMCAGITAAEKGARTVILDKMARLGGSSLISGLNFACVGSDLQKSAGIEVAPVV